MQTSMNAILEMFRSQSDKDTGQKRPAPNITQDIPSSPTRRQKTNTTNITPTSQDATQHFSNDPNDDEACKPQHLELYTLTEESAEETTMSIDATGKREEQ